jgi:hypothetical protein
MTPQVTLQLGNIFRELPKEGHIKKVNFLRVGLENSHACIAMRPMYPVARLTFFKNGESSAHNPPG